MVEDAKAKYGWEFIFLGANIDAISMAGRFGISADRAINYECDQEGTRMNYEAMGAAVSAFRRASTPLERAQAMDESGDCVREDDKKRHKKRGRRGLIR